MEDDPDRSAGVQHAVDDPAAKVQMGIDRRSVRMYRPVCHAGRFRIRTPALHAHHNTRVAVPWNTLLAGLV